MGDIPMMPTWVIFQGGWEDGKAYTWPGVDQKPDWVSIFTWCRH